MRNSTILFVLISVTSFSVRSQVKESRKEKQEMKIHFDGLRDNHPNIKQMETFINTYDKKFVFDKTDKAKLKHEELIQKRYDFQIIKSDIYLTLIFCKNQNDAQIIAETNFHSTKDNQKYGVNGAVLFVIKGKDEREINSVLSWFAGEE